MRLSIFKTDPADYDLRQLYNLAITIERSNEYRQRLSDEYMQAIAKDESLIAPDDRRLLRSFAMAEIVGTITLRGIRTVGRLTHQHARLTNLAMLTRLRMIDWAVQFLTQHNHSPLRLLSPLRERLDADIADTEQLDIVTLAIGAAADHKLYALGELLDHLYIDVRRTPRRNQPSPGNELA